MIIMCDITVWLLICNDAWGKGKHYSPLPNLSYWNVTWCAYFWDHLKLLVFLYSAFFGIKFCLGPKTTSFFFQTALRRIFGTISIWISLHLSNVWTGRIASGLVLCAYVLDNYSDIWFLACYNGVTQQAFARLSAVYGGTYMLNKPDCKVIFPLILVSK